MGVIQQSINQGISLASLLLTQTPAFSKEKVKAINEEEREKIRVKLEGRSKDISTRRKLLDEKYKKDIDEVNSKWNEGYLAGRNFNRIDKAGRVNGKYTTALDEVKGPYNLQNMPLLDEEIELAQDYLRFEPTEARQTTFNDLLVKKENLIKENEKSNIITDKGELAEIDANKHLAQKQNEKRRTPTVGGDI